jgi:hypothetical protein
VTDIAAGSKHGYDLLFGLVLRGESSVGQLPLLAQVVLSAQLPAGA